MSQFFVSGPVDIWLSWPTGAGGGGSSGAPTLAYSTPRFLGWGERAPQIQDQPLWKSVRCDTTGDGDADRIVAGQNVIVSVELNRYNNAQLSQLKARSSRVAAPFAPATATQGGVNLFGAIGTLAQTEGAAPILYLRYSFAGKATFANSAVAWAGAASMVPGYRFFCATLDPDNSTLGSNTEKKYRLTWKCIPMTVAMTGITALPAGHSFSPLNGIVYDNNLTDISSLSVD